MWSPVPGLNQRHPVYKTGALPTELTGHSKTRASPLEWRNSILANVLATVRISAPTCSALRNQAQP